MKINMKQKLLLGDMTIEQTALWLSEETGEIIKHISHAERYQEEISEEVLDEIKDLNFVSNILMSKLISYFLSNTKI
jgi:NTP pyrophosphatase (non-canonical NTP hydrolase)